MPEVHRIWDPATGITDLPSDWPAALTVPAMRDVERDWVKRRGEFDQIARSEFAERLYREWAIETGAIEGLYDIERGVTETLIEQGFYEALLEHGSVNRDPAIVMAMLNDHRSVLDMLFDYVGQTRTLTEGYVKEIHAALCRSQETVVAFDQGGRKIEVPFIKGDYKQRPNHPRRGDVVYEYCPVEHVDAEMARLVELHESQRLAGVPIETQAAWLHHRFTQIHPFQDGNGRVARALASLVFIRAGLFPLTVPLTERDSYLDVLERADAGRLRPLVLYVSRRQQAALRKAMHLAAKQVPKPTSLPEAARRVAHLYQLGIGQMGLSLSGRMKLVHSLVAAALEGAASIVRESLGPSGVVAMSGSRVCPDNEERVLISPCIDDEDETLPKTWFDISGPFSATLGVWCGPSRTDADGTVIVVPIVRADGSCFQVTEPWKVAALETRESIVAEAAAFAERCLVDLMNWAADRALENPLKDLP